MNEYRKDIPLSTETVYHWVHLGHIPGMPAWHEDLYAKSAYPFPTEKAAFRFAENNKATYPGRQVWVVTGDGERFEL